MTRFKALFSLVSSFLLLVVLLLAANSNAYGAGLAISASTVNFTAPSGGALQTRAIQVTSSAPEEFEVYKDGGGWVRFDTDYGTTPATVTIGASPALPLTVGVHTGFVTFVTATEYKRVTITFTVTESDGTGGGGGSAITAAPSEWTFNYTLNGEVPGPKVIELGSANVTAFTAAAGASWLSVTPGTGSAPGALTVSVNPAGLEANTYQTTITIDAAGTIVTVPITLNVVTGGGDTITASPSSLNFVQTYGGLTPEAKSIQVGSSAESKSFTASSNRPWLLVSPTSGTTPATLIVGVNPASLETGSHAGTITLNTGSSITTITVTFDIVSAGGESFSVNPASLVFTQKQGGALPDAQTLAITSPTPGLPYTAVWNGGWLRALPSTGFAPADVLVTANASLLTPGTYEGEVVVTAGGTTVTVPVTFTVTENIVDPPTVSPTSLSFSYNTNGALPAAKTVHVDNPTSTKPFTAAATSVGNWLSVTPATGLTPGDITVSVNPTSLSVGSYTGSVAVNIGSTTLTVPVSLVVTKTTLNSNVQPSVLGFTGTVGGAAPPPQSVFVSSSGTPFTFSTTATTANQVNWLSVTAAGTTPAPLTVSVTTAGLPAGQYTGTIAITPSDTSIGASTLNVTMTLSEGTSSAPTPIVSSVLNAASMQAGGIAPGEIIVIKGSNLGPIVGIGPEILSAGAVTSNLRGTRVLFDGIAAPLMYAQAGQITAIVPYGMYGRYSTTMQVDVSGSKSESRQVMIENTAPAVFTVSGSGSGQATVTNGDGTTNSSQRPAARNSMITIWGTGEGQTNPAGQDGRIIATDLRAPLAPVSVRIGGVPVEIRYVGSAAGVVSGTLQINVYLSADVPTGANVPLELTIGGVRSASGVTIAVQ